MAGEPWAEVHPLPPALYTLLFRLLRRILEQDELPALLEAVDHRHDTQSR